MNEADILAMTYNDTCSVYRSEKKDEDDGETRFQRVLIMSGVPCALSRSTGGHSFFGRVNGLPQQEFKRVVFTRPEVDIRAGDELAVISMGREVRGVAGIVSPYPSHNEIPFLAEGDIDGQK